MHAISLLNALNPQKLIRMKKKLKSTGKKMQTVSRSETQNACIFPSENPNPVKINLVNKRIRKK